jgi:hypothetical protein
METMTGRRLPEQFRAAMNTAKNLDFFESSVIEKNDRVRGRYPDLAQKWTLSVYTYTFLLNEQALKISFIYVGFSKTETIYVIFY